MRRYTLSLLFALFAMNSVAADIPRPAPLEDAVGFWKKVYTQVSTRQGYLHDSKNLAAVYDTLTFPAGTSARSQERIIEQGKQACRQALLSLGSGKRTGLSPLESRILAAWPSQTSNGTFRSAAENIRFQRGSLIASAMAWFVQDSGNPIFGPCWQSTICL